MSTETLINPKELSKQQLLDLLQAQERKVEEDREAYKNLVGTTVPFAVQRLMNVSAMLVDAKVQTFKLFQDILEMKASVYNTDKSKKNPQQSHTFSTDQYTITIGYRVNDSWDDTVKEGEDKVNTFIESLAKDANSAKLVKTIFRLLKKDHKGNLRASRVLELQKLADEYNNAEFNDGVKTIRDAYRPTKSCWFIEAYFTNDKQEKMSIPLSISAADFPEGFEFDFLSAEEAV
ncbi:MAG: DUF3164 family protein [Methylobacter tundripaludum]|nr:DUF3164 family protein [Methylobacter tundripaludum]